MTCPANTIGSSPLVFGSDDVGVSLLGQLDDILRLVIEADRQLTRLAEELNREREFVATLIATLDRAAELLADLAEVGIDWTEVDWDEFDDSIAADKDGLR